MQSGEVNNSIAAKESYGLSDNTNDPTSIGQPLSRHSILRILADEICNLARRIQATRRRPHLQFGCYSLPLYPTLDRTLSRGLGYKFASACSEDIEKLRRDNPWSRPLDLEMAAAAYQAGANWAMCNLVLSTVTNNKVDCSCDQRYIPPNKSDSQDVTISI